MLEKEVVDVQFHGHDGFTASKTLTWDDSEKNSADIGHAISSWTNKAKQLSAYLVLRL